MDLDDIPDEWEDEANAVRRLRKRLPKREGDVVDGLCDAVRRWHSAVFPAAEGRSLVREPWEERYLADMSELWRKGDPSSLRKLSGKTAPREQWYVHLHAARPWIEVGGALRYQLGVRLTPTSTSKRPGVRHEIREPMLATVLFPQRDGAPPRVLGWAPRTDDYLTNSEPEWAQRGDQAASAWLDLALSHAQLPRCVAVGPAGTGKTALLQHLAWVLATDIEPGTGAEPRHRIDRMAVRKDPGFAPIPILVAATTVCAYLRDNGRPRPIRQALAALLRSADVFGEDAPASQVLAGIDAGRYIFLVDSLDEVPRRDDQQALVSGLGTLRGPLAWNRLPSPAHARRAVSAGPFA